MSTRLILTLLLGITFALSMFWVNSTQAIFSKTNTAETPAVKNIKPSNNANNQLKSTNDEPSTPHPLIEPSSTPMAHSHQHDDEFDNHADIPKLETLPEPIQTQVRALSGRYETTSAPMPQAVEIKSGVTKTSPVVLVRTVPVAVINEDGSVSIHEY